MAPFWADLPIFWDFIFVDGSVCLSSSQAPNFLFLGCIFVVLGGKLYSGQLCLRFKRSSGPVTSNPLEVQVGLGSRHLTNGMCPQFSHLVLYDSRLLQRVWTRSLKLFLMESTTLAGEICALSFNLSFTWTSLSFIYPHSSFIHSFSQ